jgi:hypothetical protein
MISKLSLTIIPNFEEGEVLLINKELDWTSFDVVNLRNRPETNPKEHGRLPN